MPKPSKNEIIRCRHFAWKLFRRGKTWYADGRSNSINASRHSLDTENKLQAIDLLHELDRVRAEDLGLTPRASKVENLNKPLPLEEGRKLYEKHVSRPRVVGGVRTSTQKKYRSVFDKFLPFAESRGVTSWNLVTAQLLIDYASHLQGKGYAHKTQNNELTMLKQVIKQLIGDGHLKNMEPVKLKLRRAESQPAYCYRPDEVAEMIRVARKSPALKWLLDAVIALACTGLRISELAGLRWRDIDSEHAILSLTDETARPESDGRQRRELKSGRSRHFPIHPDLLAVLKGIEQVDQYVFHGPRGGRLKPDTVRRILIRELIEPLGGTFPTPDGEQGFKHGRLHSFRHYFCSTCANNGVPERMVMDWLGHADSEMIRHYYHLHDEEARRRMNGLDFLGGVSGRSADGAENKHDKEDVEPPSPDGSDDGDKP